MNSREQDEGGKCWEQKKNDNKKQRWGPEVQAATSESTGVRFMPLEGGEAGEEPETERKCEQ